MIYKAWITKAAKQPMVLETVDLGPLGAEDVEVAVEHCGVCHSDLSVLNNAWGVSQFPATLGHEVIGRVTAVGPHAKRRTVGQRVGVGWSSSSCMHCHQCLSGSQHLCPQVQPTIIGHRGGFASHIRAHWAWAIPLPDMLKVAEAGLYRGGGTAARVQARSGRAEVPRRAVYVSYASSKRRRPPQRGQARTLSLTQSQKRKGRYNAWVSVSY